MTTGIATEPRAGWRVVDIVVAAVIGVAFGVVFWQWNVLWAPLFAAQVNPLAYLVSGLWLVPGVLGSAVSALEDVQLLASAPIGLGEVAHDDEGPRLPVAAEKFLIALRGAIDALPMPR